jgi:muramoyltetrapeptide carboxypeptidase
VAERGQEAVPDDPIRIAVVAPACRIDPALAERVQHLAGDRWASAAADIRFHPQCFLSAGHFAGDDATRAAAFLDVANDPSIDAVWCARGGYGSGRIADTVLANLGAASRRKRYLGYSDVGFLFAGLYRAGITGVAHGPMPSDLRRVGGEVAVMRALAWLIDGDPATLEPSVVGAGRTAAFNITVLSHLIGTSLLPDLEGHVLMLEDVDEHMYRIDRALWHITNAPALRRIAGIRLGRISRVPPNEPDFGEDEVAVVGRACASAGIPYLGRADIGHDVANRIVPFGGLSGA